LDRDLLSFYNLAILPTRHVDGAIAKVTRVEAVKETVFDCIE
jgi:hypothetical protein